VAEAQIVEAAPAKLNLDLLVLRRRPDGYHELDSLVVFLGFADRLTFEPSDRLELTVGGPEAAGVPPSDENLVLRAARSLAAAAGQRPCARIRLEKHLPVAGGVGGGSADAAATLRGLARLWHLDLGPAALAAIASGLGADVPVCLGCRAARMRGTGERLDELARLPSFPVLLVNPRAPLATAQVFAALGPLASGLLRLELPGGGDMEGVLGALLESRNDLETPARRLLPVIGDVLSELLGLPGCRLARMSGSGPTCFALFGTPAETEAGARELAARRPGWLVLPAATLGARP
jgi:4-diphosphocytidyl-2-C-methyl-D-erythritol kinase